MAGSNRAARKLARATARQTAAEAISKRAAGYVRVSTEEQANHGHGLENQEERIRAFAESQGYELVDVVADRGVSGAVPPAERPGFGRLLERAAAGEFSILLVYRFDRFSRNIRHALNTVQELLTPRGIELRSVSEAVIDTGTPMGRMMFSIFAGIAEGERETITIRTKGGRVQKARRGGIACGTAPFGFRRQDDGTFAVDEEEAPVVRLIFDLREDGLTLHEIAARLNALAMRPRKGGVWRKGTVGYVLDNPRYRGDLEYVFSDGDGLAHVLVPGALPRIVDPRKPDET